MEFTEGQIIEKYASHFGHCTRIMLFPCEYEWTCISYGYNIIKRMLELSKIPGKK